MQASNMQHLSVSTFFVYLISARGKLKLMLVSLEKLQDCDSGQKIVSSSGLTLHLPRQISKGEYRYSWLDCTCRSTRLTTCCLGISTMQRPPVGFNLNVQNGVEGSGLPTNCQLSLIKDHHPNFASTPQNGSFRFNSTFKGHWVWFDWRSRPLRLPCTASCRRIYSQRSRCW